MTGEAATREDLDQLRASLEKKIDGLTEALRDLIRIDGDMKRIQDAQSRIGRQVDDHETRLRVVEIAQPSAKRASRFMDKIPEWLISASLGGIAVYIAQHLA